MSTQIPWPLPEDGAISFLRTRKRQGATLVGEGMRDFVSGRLPRQVWRLDREAWLARRRA